MFTDCASDILLEICAYLELRDVLSFTSVCSSFRKLVDSKYLWVTVLQRTQRHRNLACPVDTDISQLDIADLHRIACLTSRVEGNWSQETPKLARAIKSVYIFPGDDNIEPVVILAVIPATSLVILYTQHSQGLILCDSERKIPLHRFPLGNIIRRAHFDEAGRHLIAFIVRQHPDPETFLLIFSIEYGADKSPAIQQIFHSSLASQWQLTRALFLYKDVAGVIPYSENGSSASLLAINFVHDSSVIIPLTHEDFMGSTAYVSCSIVNETPFIVTMDEPVYRVYRVSTDILSGGGLWEDGATIDDPGSVVRVVEIHEPEDEDSYDYETPEVKWSPRGLHVLHVLYNDGVSGLLHMHTTHTRPCLWPIETPFDRLPPYHPSEILATATINGKVASCFRDAPWLVASSQSGMYCIAVIQHDSDDARPISHLYLCQYDSYPSRVQARQLSLPCNISLNEIYSLAMDERYGIIYLSHVRGRLLAIHYA